MVFYKSVLVGGAGGVIGQYFASPFFLVKTHLQAQAVQAIAVGYQHNHVGTGSALLNMFVKSGVSHNKPIKVVLKLSFIYTNEDF